VLSDVGFGTAVDALSSSGAWIVTGAGTQTKQNRFYVKDNIKLKIKISF
jgi:hypothetical protein